MSKEEILAKIVVYLAGRSAEEVEFGSVTTGASNDIEMATSLARSMISVYGMSDKFDMMALEKTEGKYINSQKTAIVGDITIAELDNEVLSIIKECHNKARTLLEENKESLRAIAEFLASKETITGEEFMAILEDCRNKADVQA